MELWERVKTIEREHRAFISQAEVLIAENEILKQQLASALSNELDNVNRLLDLLESDIAAKEQIILTDERLINVIAAYRVLRPKGDK